MPHNKSCKKRLITSRKRRERNRDNKAAMRSALKQFRNTAAGSDERQAGLTEMYSTMDMLARKGIIPRKRASRLKSRLAAFAAASISSRLARVIGRADGGTVYADVDGILHRSSDGGATALAWCCSAS